ncbi:MAG: NfeD family protein [Bacteroidales bacterium]|nr:NfeD family protein [Bacteroidales bacterium]
MGESIFSKPEMIWFIIGLVLFILELVLPGFVIFFFAVGAWITALVCLIADPGINLQVIIFAVTSVLALVALRKIIKNKLYFSKDNRSEEVEDEFTGREALALTDFNSDGKGKVEFKGTSWSAESGAEIKAGQNVIISAKNNVKLIVEPKK